MQSAPGSIPDGSALERTRLSWMRTGLATMVVGFLLVRGWLTDAEPWTLAALAAVSTAIVVALSASRFAALGRRTSPAVQARSLRWVTGGIVVLAAIALARLLLGT
jgi:hypothetical protein